MISVESLADFLEVEPEDINPTRVRVLSSKAAALVRQYKALPDDVGKWPEEVTDLVLSMVARSLSRTETDGVASSSVTSGPFSQSVTYSGDASSVWLTKGEKAMLRGAADGGAFGVYMAVDPDFVPRRMAETWSW